MWVCATGCRPCWAGRGWFGLLALTKSSHQIAMSRLSSSRGQQAQQSRARQAGTCRYEECACCRWRSRCLLRLRQSSQPMTMPPRGLACEGHQGRKAEASKGKSPEPGCQAARHEIWLPQASRRRSLAFADARITFGGWRGPAAHLFACADFPISFTLSSPRIMVSPAACSRCIAGIGTDTS